MIFSDTKNWTMFIIFTYFFTFFNFWNFIQFRNDSANVLITVKIFSNL